MDDNVVERLERIERRLELLEARSARPAPPPPPVPTFYEGPPQAVRASVTPDVEALAAAWMPRLGALAVVLAFAYLVGLGLQRGLITPAMVAIGIALVCVGVTVLGLRMRGEREIFGNVLVGLAAGGLYVDAVGANQYQAMLSGEATVAFCLGLSLAVVGFGARRALPAFLGVGLFGGLLAALMPIRKDAYEAAAVLYGVATAPAFAVAAVRRWPLAAVGAWLASFATAFAFLFRSMAPFPGVLPVEAVLLMGVLAYGWAAERLPEQDPQGAFPYCASTITGVVVLADLHRSVGAAHLALLGLAVAAIGAMLRPRPAASGTMAAGAILTLALAPLALPLGTATWILALLATVSGLALGRSPWRRISMPLVVIQAGLALGTYVVAALLPDRPNVAEESLRIGLVAPATVTAAWAFERSEGRVVAGVVLWGLATRTGVLLLPFATNASVTLTWIGCFALALILGFAFRWSEVRRLALLMAAATAAKVAVVDLSDLEPALKAATLLALGVVLLGGGYAYVRTKGRTEG